MKWPSLLGFAATAVTAASVLPCGGFKSYRLVVSAKDSDLDGREIQPKDSAQASTSELGIYPDLNNTSIQVYPTQTQSAGLYSLHTVPSPLDVGRGLGLVDGPGLFNFVAVVQNGSTITNSTQWPLFRWDGGFVTVDTDGQWLAFPSTENSGWDLRWSDGTAVMIEDFITVQITYSPW